MQAGADDYLAKHELETGNILARSLRYAITRKHLEGQVRVRVEELRRQAAEITRQYEHLAMLVDNVDISLGIMDKAGHMLAVNKAWEARTGLRREQVLGKRYEQFDGDPQAMQSYQALIDNVLATGEARLFREMFVQNGVRPDGFYVDASMIPIRDSDGNVAGLLSVSLDVTEKVRAREEVETQRALLETILETVPVAIAYFDKDMRIVNANAAWVEMTGLDPQAAVGRILYDLIPQAEARRSFYERTLSGESSNFRDLPYRHPDGTTRYVDAVYRPVCDAAGKTIGMLAAAVDVTDRKKIDEQKDEFFALASHELKTPLTAIKGYSQMALLTVGASGDERLVRMLRALDKKTDVLTKLINEMLDMSSIEQGELPLETQHVDLVQLVQAAINGLELTAAQFGVRYDLPDDPVMVNVDAQRIEQVLTNLVTNAMKYSGDSRQVDIAVVPGGDEVITSVRDYGVGIPAGQLELVFGRFFRAGNVSATRYPGLGLGLYISEGIISRHSGRIWVESTEGSGSTFYFSLPLLPQ
jgi:PAS domain S-box-containing protein